MIGISPPEVAPCRSRWLQIAGKYRLALHASMSRGCKRECLAIATHFHRPDRHHATKLAGVTPALTMPTRMMATPTVLRSHNEGRAAPQQRKPKAGGDQHRQGAEAEAGHHDGSAEPGPGKHGVEQRGIDHGAGKKAPDRTAQEQPRPCRQSRGARHGVHQAADVGSSPVEYGRHRHDFEHGKPDPAERCGGGPSAIPRWRSHDRRHRRRQTPRRRRSRPPRHIRKSVRR